MKNYMKKIIVGFAALALMLVASSAFASGPFNGQSGDCPNMGIGNVETGVGIGDGQYGCWTTNTVSATAGDYINVVMFYHNNTQNDLTGVRASFNAPSSGPASSYSFSGTMHSDQGSTPLGSVSLNLTSSQTLTYVNSHWFADKNAIDSDTPTQSGIMSGGQFNIGTVPPGWDDYGELLMVFKVGTNSTGGTCQDTTANNYGGTLPCTYNQSNCTISNFTGNGSTSTYIQSGGAVNLVWSTYGCTSATVTGPNGYFNSSLSNSTTTYPTNSGTYTLTAYGSTGGTQTRTVYVSVNDTQSYCTISNFTGNGSTSTTIQQGGALNLAWSTYGCTSVNVSGPGISSNSFSSSQIMYPSNNAQYIITAYGNTGGTQTRYVYVTVNPTIIAPPVYNTCAVTTVATNVGQNSATLNGLLTGSVGASYFQYGTSVNLGSQTVSRVSSGSFSEVVTGLIPNTAYYFRLVSQCGGGLSYGQIQVFQTQGTVVNTIRQVVVQGTTVVGTQSPIMLKIENRYQYIGLGDIVDYTVTYKNIGKTTLTRPILQVIVPSGITLINSSRGTYSTDTNTLTVQLEDLLPNAEGVVYLQGRVDMITSGVAQIVTTAVLVYTSPSGAQENAIAYVLNSPRDIGNVLGASAFWSGLWNMGLIGWLLLLILILLIILLTRRYYGNSKSVVQKTTPTGTSTTTTHY